MPATVLASMQPEATVASRSLFGGFQCGKTNYGPGTMAAGAVDGDRAMMVLDDFLGDEQPESGAASWRFAGIKRLEDMGQVLLVDAFSVIGYNKFDRIVRGGACDKHVS